MKRLLAATATLTLLAAAGPALAATPKNAPCKAPAGGVVLKTGAAAVSSVVATPIGAGSGIFSDFAEEAGTFYLDLGGKPQGGKGKATFTLSWDNPASDYDVVVNGVNDLSSDNPEVKTISVSHCRAIKVSTDVFVGVPVDELTLTAKGS